MAEIVPSYLFKETRVNLDSAFPASTVNIRFPAQGLGGFTSRIAQRRSHIGDVSGAEDDKAFRQKHLATAASIYHRRYHDSPRSFLWRILEDSRVLAIRAVDICKQEKIADANLTLRFTFPTPIRSACVAFSDPKEHDILSAFILTEGNQLFTLSLRPEFFRKASATEENVGDWCKTYVAGAFSFKHPHRLVALRSEELLVSLHDGMLLKLERKAGEDSSSWKETFYNEGGWTQNLRSLIPFQGSNTVRYGKINYELSAVTSIASPAATIAGTPYAFTVSLDHKLRIWNLTTGRIGYAGDILGQERLPNELGRYVIHPSHSNLVKVYGDDDTRVLVATYSPVGMGEFKFWTAEPSEEEGLITLTDLFPGNKLEPRAPTTDVWTLTDFSVTVGQHGAASLWVLWKNNTTYRVQKLDFSFASSAGVDEIWSNGWIGMATETLVDAPLPTILPSDPADQSEKWLSYILYPGRFTTASIETALAIYRSGAGGPPSKDLNSRTSKNIAERMCSLIGSTATLEQGSDGDMDYGQWHVATDTQWRRFYRLITQFCFESCVATDTQWRRFYRLITELEKHRGEALSLAIDSHLDVPWIITADGVSLIRECSTIERLWHNFDLEMPGTAERVATVLSAAAAFRETFSDALLHNCHTALKAELFQDPSATEPIRIRAFYDKCNFVGQIGDEEYAQLTTNLGSFSILSQELYESLIGAMTVSDETDLSAKRAPLADYGFKTVVRGIQETIELHRNICFDQLVLLVFVEGEIDQQEEEMNLDTALVYKQLLAMLKRLELLDWLAKKQISSLMKEGRRSISKGTSGAAKKSLDESKTMTILEGTIGHLLGFDTNKLNHSMASTFTDSLVRVCDPDAEYELVAAIIQCFLLRSERVDLALEFMQFCTQDPFATYIQGRTYLVARDLPSAAICFKKAAYGLSFPEGRTHSDRHSSGLMNETEWNLLNAGLPKYYSHIVSLYDKEKLFSYVVDFARLALQFASTGAAAKSTDMKLLRTELHSRLFNAAIQTSTYDIAHSTLVRFTDQALQASSLRTLVTRMCETSRAADLLEYPFIGLQDLVDSVLSAKCESIVDVNVGVPYHQILYAWRIKRGDYRGAASVSFERLQRIQLSNEADKAFGQEALETPVTQGYLALINALSCVDPKQAWILTEPITKKGVPQKRKVITLEDVRRHYQEELDRIAAIENNQFAFNGEDDMDML